MSLVFSGCGGSGPTASPTVEPTPTAGLFVDAGSDRGPISPLVYGTNTGPWLAVPFELQPQIAEMGLTTLTFPGGNWGDENDTEVYQIDQFIEYCRGLKAEPRIVVRLRDSTPEEAAAEVNYANVIQKYDVKYWGIGNEVDLYQANGFDYTLDDYTRDWRAFAEAMKAVDPTIKLIGPDVSQFVADPTSEHLQFRTNWLRTFLKVNGDLVDVVSIHRYPYPDDSGNPPTKSQLRTNSKEWDQIIPALREIVRAETGRDIPVAVTEVNSSWAQNAGGEATMDSHYNAIWWADVLGRLIEQDVTMVDQFDLAGTWGIVGAIAPNPMYYTYLMYKEFGTERVRAVSDDRYVSVYASRRPDGTLAIMIVNLGPTAQTKPLTVLGWAGHSADVWLFDASHKAQQVAGTTLATGSVTLPPESVTLLIVEKPKPGI